MVARSPCAIHAAARCEAEDNLANASSACGEGDLGLVEAALLEQRAAEDEPGVADLVEHVVALADDLERVARLLLGLLDVAGAEVHLRERRDRLGRVLVAPDLERDRRTPA